MLIGETRAASGYARSPTGYASSCSFKPTYKTKLYSLYDSLSLLARRNVTFTDGVLPYRLTATIATDS